MENAMAADTTVAPKGPRTRPIASDAGRGTEAITEAIRRTGRRFVLGGTVGAALAAGAVAWIVAGRQRRP